MALSSAAAINIRPVVSRLVSNRTPFSNDMAMALQLIQEALDSLRSRLDEVIALLGVEPSAPAVATPTSYVADVPLTLATTEITWEGVVPNRGDHLVLFVSQDAAGGRQITWNSAKYAYATTQIGTTPNCVNAFRFVAKSDGKWYMTGLPLLEQTP